MDLAPRFNLLNASGDTMILSAFKRLATGPLDNLGLQVSARCSLQYKARDRRAMAAATVLKSGQLPGTKE
jgi:hypothetical protein